jgi:hypothetical protein
MLIGIYKEDYLSEFEALSSTQIALIDSPSFPAVTNGGTFLHVNRDVLFYVSGKSNHEALSRGRAFLDWLFNIGRIRLPNYSVASPGINSDPVLVSSSGGRSVATGRAALLTFQKRF